MDKQENFQEYEQRINKIILKKFGRKIDKYEIKVLINNSLCFRQIFNFYMLKKWYKQAYTILDLFEINEELINLYDEDFEDDIIQMKEYLFRMHFMKDNMVPVLQNFKILITIDALNGDKEALKIDDSLGKCMQLMCEEYNKFSIIK